MYIDGPADLMIEILSPSTKKTDLMIKIPRCLEKGVQEIWAIDPMLQELTVYSPNSPSKLYKKEGIIKSTILKDFWIKIEWLWSPETKDPIDCLNEILSRK
ncbi:MAG: Uma2 family endonuclease [Candidatus Helarchaeota archaeon]